MVTDYGEGPETDFILSPKAYAGLARDKKAAKKLFEQGVVEVEYQRIDCGFPEGSFYYKIDEEHSNPHYFAILLLYHGDKYYITRVKAVYIDEVYIYNCTAKCKINFCEKCLRALKFLVLCNLIDVK